MSISAYVGLPGHGKSYGVVCNVILPALKDGRTVFTNIPMNSELLKKDFKNDVIPFDVQDIVDNENWWSEVFIAGAVLVIDELWRLWPNGIKASQIRESDKSFLAEHRHMVGDNKKSTEIILVTQDLSQIAMFARQLVERTVRVEKLDRFGFSKRYKVFWYFGPVTGAVPPKSKIEKIASGGKFKKEVYQYYKSHTKSESGAGDETGVDGRSNVFMSSSVFLGIAFIVCGIWFAFWAYGNFFSSLGGEKLEEVKTINESKEAPDKPLQAPQPKANPKPKKPEFLAEAEVMYIVWNNGIFPKIDYRFRIDFEDTHTIVNMRDLAFMDYKIKPINDCLVRVTGEDFDGYIMCPSYREKRNFLEEQAHRIVQAP